MRGQFLRVPYNHLIKKLNICNIPLSEIEEYDIWRIFSMYSLLRVSLYIRGYTTTEIIPSIIFFPGVYTVTFFLI